MDKIIKNLKYVPKLSTALAYILLLALALVLFFGRNYEALRFECILKILPDFYGHVSNFSLTLIIYTVIGYVGLLVGLTNKHIRVVGFLMVLINFIFELFIPILNTPDIKDLFYGIVGALVGFFFLYAAKVKGLRQNNLVRSKIDP